jgi:hypothetical protein
MQRVNTMEELTQLVTMDDWFDSLRDGVIGIGMTTEEEEVIRNFLPSFNCLFFNFFSVC